MTGEGSGYYTDSKEISAVMANRVYEIVDYILNEATDPEVEIIISAIKRRLEDAAHGLDKMNPKKLARSVSSQVTEDIGGSIDQIRTMVRGFVAEKIKQQAPEISEGDLEELLKAWVPEPGKGEPRSEKSNLPKDALMTMIKQFLSYSLGTMSATEQAELGNEIPDWQEKYWREFPEPIRATIARFLKGNIDEEEFWRRIAEVVGPDAGE